MEIAGFSSTPDDPDRFNTRGGQCCPPRFVSERCTHHSGVRMWSALPQVGRADHYIRRRELVGWAVPTGPNENGPPPVWQRTTAARRRQWPAVNGRVERACLSYSETGNTRDCFVAPSAFGGDAPRNDMGHDSLRDTREVIASPPRRTKQSPPPRRDSASIARGFRRPNKVGGAHPTDPWWGVV